MNRSVPISLFVLILLAVAAWRTALTGNEKQLRHNQADSAAADDMRSGRASTVGDDRAALLRAAERRDDETREPHAARGAPVKVLGRLVRASGRPLAKVDVGLWLDPARGSYAPDWTSSVASAAAPATATSGADGTFELWVEAGRAGAVRTASAEWVLAKGAVRFGGSTRDIELGDLAVHESSAIAGVVHDSQGRPVSGAYLTLWHRHGAAAPAGRRADSAGRFELLGLPPGAFHLMVAAAEHLSALERFELAPGERRTDLTIVLSRGSAITGVVVDDLGVPVSNADVSADAVGRTAPSAREASISTTQATTNRAGQFSIATIALGTTTVTVDAKGHQRARTADVAPGRPVVITLARNASVSGTLVTGDGTPIAGSRVWATSGEAPKVEIAHGGATAQSVAASFGAPATTRADGSFQLSDVAPGKIVLHAAGEHADVELAGLTLAPGQALSSVRLTAEHGVKLTVRVVAPSQEPVPDASVQVLVDRASRRPTPSGTTDDEGRATFPGLPEGTVEVRVAARGWVAPDAMPVRLSRERDAEIELTVRAGGFVEVTTLDEHGTPLAMHDFRLTARAAEGTPSARSWDERLRRQTLGRTDARGVARLGPLAPGSYTAALLQSPNLVAGESAGDRNDIEATRVPFTIVENQTARVTLRMPVLATVHGTVTGAGGAVAGAAITALHAGERARARATTDAAGRFRLDDVEPGSYVLEVVTTRGAIAFHERLDVPAKVASVRKDVHLTTAKLRVVVTSADTDRPVADAHVVVSRQGTALDARPSRPGRSTIARTDDTGTVELELPTATYAVTAEAPDHARTSKPGVVVTAEAIAETKLALEPSSQVVVHVVDAGSRMVQRFELEYRRVEATSQPQLSWGSNGTARLQSLGQGVWSLRARIREQRSPFSTSPATAHAWGPPQQIEVGKAGQRDVTLTVGR